MAKHVLPPPTSSIRDVYGIRDFDYAVDANEACRRLGGISRSTLSRLRDELIARGLEETRIGSKPVYSARSIERLLHNAQVFDGER